jgi:hypothetical protein
MAHRRKNVQPKDADGDRIEWDIPVKVVLPSDWMTDSELAALNGPVTTYVDPRYISQREWK